MGNDITSQRAAAIASAKVFETSDNLRCGKYKLLIKRIIDGMITTRDGERPGTIFELTPLVSEPLPQAEGNMIAPDGKIVPWGTAGAKLMDDGMSPNAPGSTVALKIFYDGAGARSAPGNTRQVVLGLFNKHEGEVSATDVAKTWLEFFTLRPFKKGEQFAELPDGTKFYADRDLPQSATVTADGKVTTSSALLGMVIDCVVASRKKSKTNDKGSHISKPVFSNRSVPGMGDNAPELVAKRRAELEDAMEDDEAIETPPPGNTAAAPAANTAPTAPVIAPPAPTPPAPAAPPTPPAPVAWAPPAPWHKPAGQDAYAPNPDPKNNWFWNGQGGADSVKSEAQLRAGQ